MIERENKMLRLLSTETWESNTPVILENQSGGKDFFIESDKAIQLNLENKNRRVYPKENVEKELIRYNDELIQTGRAWGELGHPPNAQINESKISHRFVSMEENGPNFYKTKAKVLDTPNGQIIKALISDNVGKLGISTRALGSLKEQNGVNYVQKDFKLITVGDLVADPSAQSAFVQGVYEGAVYEIVDGRIIEHAVTAVKPIIKEEYKSNLSAKEKQYLFMRAFSKILDAVKNIS